MGRSGYKEHPLLLIDKSCTLKLCIGTAASLALARLAGCPETPTAAITTVLILYTDRGETGSLRYGWKRVLTQVMMAVPCVLLVTLARDVFGLGSWTPTVTSPILIFMGIALNQKLQFAPLNATLCNAALILVCGSMAGPAFAMQRVIQCGMGALVGWAVYFLVSFLEGRMRKPYSGEENSEHLSFSLAAPSKGFSSIGKKVYVDLTHPFGAEIPRWPYFDKPDIVGAHSMAKGGVLTQSIKCTMHTGTHCDAPRHVMEYIARCVAYIDEDDLSQDAHDQICRYSGTGCEIVEGSSESAALAYMHRLFNQNK